MSEPTVLDAKQFVLRMRDDKVFRDGIILYRDNPLKLKAALNEANCRFTQDELRKAITEVDGLGSLATDLRGIILY